MLLCLLCSNYEKWFCHRNIWQDKLNLVPSQLWSTGPTSGGPVFLKSKTFTKASTPNTAWSIISSFILVRLKSNYSAVHFPTCCYIPAIPFYHMMYVFPSICQICLVLFQLKWHVSSILICWFQEDDWAILQCLLHKNINDIIGSPTELHIWRWIA